MAPEIGPENILSNSPDPILKEVYIEGTPSNEEVHRETKAEFDKQAIEATRQEIITRYGIALDRIFLPEPTSNSKRETCAFVILANFENPEQKYYVEGHTAHIKLLDQLLANFPKIGFKNADELPADEWSITKGLIDPHNNGFKNFPETQKALTNLMLNYRDLNGISEQEAQDLKANDNPELPNWFLTGSSEVSKSS